MGTKIRGKDFKRSSRSPPPIQNFFIVNNSPGLPLAPATSIPTPSSSPPTLSAPAAPPRSRQLPGNDLRLELLSRRTGDPAEQRPRKADAPREEPLPDPPPRTKANKRRRRRDTWMRSNYPQLEFQVLPAAPPSAVGLQPPAPRDVPSPPEAAYPTAADLLALLQAPVPLGQAAPDSSSVELPCLAVAPAPAPPANVPAPFDPNRAMREAARLHARGLPSMCNIPVPGFLPPPPPETPHASRSPSPEHMSGLLAYDSVDLEDPTCDDRVAASPPRTCASDMDISPVAGPASLLEARPSPARALPSPVARRALGPYLNRHGIQFPSSHSLARAVELVEGDRTVPEELVPRLRILAAETRLAGGVYLRDLVSMCRSDADSSASAGAGRGGPAPSSRRGRRPRPTSPNPPTRLSDRRPTTPSPARAQRRLRSRSPLPDPDRHFSIGSEQMPEEDFDVILESLPPSDTSRATSPASAASRRSASPARSPSPPNYQRLPTPPTPPAAALTPRTPLSWPSAAARPSA